MYVVYLECGGEPVATDQMSVKLDVAKHRANRVAVQMLDLVKITVRHHKRTGEIFYRTPGAIGTER